MDRYRRLDNDKSTDFIPQSREARRTASTSDARSKRTFVSTATSMGRVALFPVTRPHCVSHARFALRVRERVCASSGFRRHDCAWRLLFARPFIRLFGFAHGIRPKSTRRAAVERVTRLERATSSLAKKGSTRDCHTFYVTFNLIVTLFGLGWVRAGGFSGQRQIHT